MGVILAEQRGLLIPLGMACRLRNASWAAALFPILGQIGRSKQIISAKWWFEACGPFSNNIADIIV
jgi:hypothetical protein